MLTTTTSLPPEIQASIDDVLLAVRTPHAIHNVAALPKRLKSRGGTTIRMSRFDRLPTAPVPLGPSGQTPPSTSLNRVDIDATVSFYGQWVAINQQVNNTACFKSVLIEMEALT